MAEADDFSVGDWVRVDRAPAGYADYVRSSVGAQITYRHAESAEVSLYDSRGRTQRTGMSVRYAYLTKIDQPVFRTATSDIPNTAEVQALKDIIYTHAMTVGRRSGMCSVLHDALDELGVQKPPPGKVKAKVTFEVEVDPDQIITYTHWRSFSEAFDKLSPSDQARVIIARSDYSLAKVEYEVIPPEPAPLPTPVAAPEPATEAVEESDDEEERPLINLDAEPRVRIDIGASA